MFFNDVDSSYLLSAYKFWKINPEQIHDHSSLTNLQNNIQYQFKDKTHLFKALEHKSFVHEFTDLAQGQNNEKLEFFGDAILDMIVTERIFNLYHDHAEGELSRLRAALVNETSLAEIAKFLELDRCLLIGKGEFGAKGFEKNSLLSDVFEALVAAIYLDSNFDSVRNVVLSIIKRFEKNSAQEFFNIEKILNFDAKTKLQNICMKLYAKPPKYNAVELKEGLYQVEILINNTVVASATNSSKKNAKKMLAKQVLEEELYQNINE